ncbi:TolB family protein [Streptomyces sp. NPDC057702]|uniref:TolB family protein n=1 Tax=unclassified Streptomyces TaxID=2593676 RepID=UPI0036CA7D9E
MAGALGAWLAVGLLPGAAAAVGPGGAERGAAGRTGVERAVGKRGGGERVGAAGRVGGGREAGRFAAGRTERVGLAHDGAQLNRDAHGYALRADGRSLIFTTEADHVVPGDTDGRADTFVRDLDSGHVERLDLIGSQWEVVELSASADGRFLAFAARRTEAPPDELPEEDLFLHDRHTHRTEPLLPTSPDPGKGLQMVEISANGRTVVFQSVRPDLVPGDTNGVADIFAYDRWQGSVRRANVYSDGTQAPRAATQPVVSGDGRRVGFISRTPVGDPRPGPARGPAAPSATPQASGSAKPPESVEPPGPSGSRKPRFEPLYVHDLDTGRTVAASTTSDGTDVGATRGSLSADGRFALFASRSHLVVPGDANGVHDLFLRDLERGTTERVSLTPGGGEANGESVYGVLSPDGRTLLFTSDASNLVPGDTNEVADLFARDLRTGAVERLTIRADGTQSSTAPEEYAGAVLTDAEARQVVFVSADDHLVPGDTNAVSDLFARHRGD